MNSAVATRISTASGDPGALLALAIELAQENAALRAQADALLEMDRTRKAAQAARKQRSRHGMSRDVTVQGVTECDVSPSPLPSSSFPTPHITTSFPPTPSPHLPAPRTIRVLPAVPPDVATVRAHYCTVHPKRRPGPKDDKAIAKALGLGFSAAELCEAIDGNAADSWHREKHKHDLPYLLRDSGQIDNFRGRAEPAMTMVFHDGWYSDVKA